MNWQHVRAVLIGAAEAAAGSAIPLLTTQSWTVTLSTFGVLFVLIAVGNLLHLNLTPAQQAQLAATLVPAVERLLPALLALIERQPVAPAPPVVTVVTPQPAPTPPPSGVALTPAADATVTVTETPAPAATAPPRP